jgi:hypothetical protein
MRLTVGQQVMAVGHGHGTIVAFEHLDGRTRPRIRPMTLVIVELDTGRRLPVNPACVIPDRAERGNSAA